jgi:hypothetical protein
MSAATNCHCKHRPNQCKDGVYDLGTGRPASALDRLRQVREEPEMALQRRLLPVEL